MECKIISVIQKRCDRYRDVNEERLRGDTLRIGVVNLICEPHQRRSTLTPDKKKASARNGGYWDLIRTYPSTSNGSILFLYFLFVALPDYKLFSDSGKLWIRLDRGSMYPALLILEALGAKYVIFVMAWRNRISTLTEFCEVSPAFFLKKKRKNSTSPIVLNFCIDFRKFCV